MPILSHDVIVTDVVSVLLVFDRNIAFLLAMVRVHSERALGIDQDILQSRSPSR